jgi:hypothetical protein
MVRNTLATPRAAAGGSAGAVDEHRQGQAYLYREAEPFEDDHGMIHRGASRTFGQFPDRKYRPVPGPGSQENHGAFLTAERTSERRERAVCGPSAHSWWFARSCWSVPTGYKVLHGL